MTIPEVFTEKNIEFLGTPIDFALIGHDAKVAADRVELALSRNHIATVTNFPSTQEDLFYFAQFLGTPMLKHSSMGVGTQPSAFIGDVRLRPDIPAEKRLPTQKDVELTFHTAHAYSNNRPRYFAMLMADPGWRDQESGFNGESLLVRWKDVVTEYQNRYPITAETDLIRLMQTPISYAPWYAQRDVANSPIMSFLPEGDVELRYWESMFPIIEQLTNQGVIAEGDMYMDVLRRFDEITNSCGQIVEYPMQKGQLTIMDNRRVAHARRPFLPSKITPNGLVEYNPRQIYSIHIA